MMKRMNDEKNQVVESFLRRNPKASRQRQAVLKTIKAVFYKNSSIFLIMSRSFPGGGDRGSAISVRK
jgi:hypothetical protein